MRNETVEKVKHAIRERYAWPGGYAIVIVMEDGAGMCTKCAKENFRQIVSATKKGPSTGWAAAGTCLDEEFQDGEETPQATCCHCNKVIGNTEDFAKCPA